MTAVSDEKKSRRKAMKRNAIVVASLCLFVVAFVWMAAAQDTSTPNIVGIWAATIHRSKADGNLEQQWTIKQDGSNLAGTAKGASGDLPMTEVKQNGLILRAVITDGEMHYVVNASVASTGDTMDGTIRMGTHEYLLTVKRSPK
jgi:hypothetical protein